ncbi:MAG TPA: TolC family protein, partial [Myxococcota bacterium]|nr:TolC family protein [Myxococcota bacterium]
DHQSRRARVRASEAALGRGRLEVAAHTRSAYVEAVVARELRVLAEQFFALASRQLEATESRVRAGEASDMNLRLARLEQVKAAQSLLQARNDEAVALATLATLVQRPITGEDLAVDPLDAAPEPQPGGDDERSDVQAARLALEAAEAAIRREQAAALPPVTLGAFFEEEGGSVLAGPSLSLTLPLWHQNQAGIADARATETVARSELDLRIARAAAEQKTATYAYSEAVSTLALVPATADDANAALASIDAGLRSGELDLVTTILLRAEVISGQQAMAQARGDLAVSRLFLLLATEDTALLDGSSP